MATSRRSAPPTPYNKIAEGDISLAVANLHTAENSLNAQESQLQDEQSQAQTQVTAEQNAVSQNQQAIASQKSALSQEQGQIATARPGSSRQPRRPQPPRRRSNASRLRPPLPQPLTAAPASHAPRVLHRAAALSQAAPPPSSAGGAGAVQAAESQIGVPYVWGAESPKGSASPGFDCSGLTAWSWGQVGVGLPHYSGAQMADSTPVPDQRSAAGRPALLRPRRLRARRHVRRWRQMIEAPYTGASVWITGLRLGGDFVGAGRP